MTTIDIENNFAVETKKNTAQKVLMNPQEKILALQAENPKNKA